MIVGFLQQVKCLKVSIWQWMKMVCPSLWMLLPAHISLAERYIKAIS